MPFESPPANQDTELEAIREDLLGALRAQSVIRPEQEQILGLTGKPMRWLVDTRVLLLNPVRMRQIALLFLDAVKDLGEFQLACLEMTGIPLMVGIQHTALSLGRAINGLVIRKEPKKNGRMRAIEGTPNKLPVIFVDDLLNTAATFRHGFSVLQFNGLEVPYFWALVDFYRESGANRVLDAGCSFITEFAAEELGVELNTLEKPPASFPLTKVWQHRPNPAYRGFHAVPKSRPVANTETVFYGAENGLFYAVDSAGGATRWSYKTGRSRKGIWSSPVLLGSGVIFGAYDGCVYSLDQSTGSLKWRFDEADWVGSSPAVLPGNRIVIGLEHSLRTSRGSIVCLEGTTGERVWEFAVPGLVHGTPIFVEKHGYVCVGTNDGELLVLDAEMGTLRALISVGGAVKSEPTWDALHDTVLFGSFDANLYSVSLDTFEILWVVDAGAPVYSKPLVDGAKIWLASADHGLYCIASQTGGVIRRIELSGKLLGGPRMFLGCLYQGATSGRLYAVDPNAMEVLGHLEFHDRLTTSIAPSPTCDRVYALTNDGVLTALDSKLS